MRIPYDGRCAGPLVIQFLLGKYCSKVLYITIIFVIIDAFQYQREYYIDDDFDNMMVDDNLRRKWKVEGEARLTPMRNWELKERYQKATSVTISNKEKAKMIRQSISTIIVTIIVVAIVVGDSVFTAVLITFAENAKFGLSFPGMEQGISFTAFLCQSNPLEQVIGVEAFDLSSEVCLPKALKTTTESYAVIFSVLFVCLLSCAIDAYSTRLRPLVCHIFYPERAKQRANYLYKYVSTIHHNHRII